MKENKSYDDKSKSYKVSGIVSLVSVLVGIVSLTFGILSVTLSWSILPFFIIVFFLISATSFVLSYIFLTKRLLHYRVGDLIDIHELNDLRNKLEKYNLNNKN